MQYQTTPISYAPPAKDEREEVIECGTCHQQIRIRVRSIQKIWLLRLIGLVPIAAGAFLGWLFGIVLFERFSEGLRTITGIGFVGLVIWGLYMLIKSKESLAFKIDKEHASIHSISWKPRV